MRTPTAWSRNESRQQERWPRLGFCLGQRPGLSMKPHLAGVAADRLARAADGAPMAEDEVLRVLARIARTGKPGDRLRAAELIGKQLGMFREETQHGPTLEEIVLEAERLRRCRLSAAPLVEVTALVAPTTGEPQ